MRSAIGSLSGAAWAAALNASGAELAMGGVEFVGGSAADAVPEFAGCAGAKGIEPGAAFEDCGVVDTAGFTPLRPNSNLKPPPAELPGAGSLTDDAAEPGAAEPGAAGAGVAGADGVGANGAGWVGAAGFNPGKAGLAGFDAGDDPPAPPGVLEKPKPVREVGPEGDLDSGRGECAGAVEGATDAGAGVADNCGAGVRGAGVRFAGAGEVRASVGASVP